MNEIAGQASLLFIAATCLGCGSAENNKTARDSSARLGLALAHDSARATFSHIGAARELADGRVLVLDTEDGAVFAADFTDGRVVPVGRQGSGPGEYQVPRWLLPYRGDTSVLVDPVRLSAIHMISADGRVSTRTVGSERDMLRLHTFRNATDSLGHLFAQVSRFIHRDGQRILDPDSALIERISLPTGVRDTVAVVSTARHLPAQSRVSTQQPTANQPFRVVNLPFATMDEWSALPDGRIVVATVSPFRLSLRGPGAQGLDGPLVPSDSVAVTELHKEQWRMEKQRARTVLQFTQGGVTAGKRKLPYEEPEQWPSLLPPFLEGALKIASDGTIWIERTVPAGSESIIDVFSVNAKRVARIQLPPNRRLVSVSASRVYLAHVDSDGLQVLERWQRPRI
jgi:hypothetical protein